MRDELGERGKYESQASMSWTVELYGIGYRFGLGMLGGWESEMCSVSK